MTLRFDSIDSMPAHLRDKARKAMYEQHGVDQPSKKAAALSTSKHGNVRCSDESGVQFDSLLERDVDAAIRATGKKYFRQVSIPLVRGENGRWVRMRPDFLVIHEVREDGTFVGQFVDAKGRELTAWKNKAATMFHYFGVKVKRVTRQMLKKGELF